MKKIIASLAIILLLAACSRKEQATGTDTPALMVSIEPQRWLLEQLVAPGTQIGVMLQNGADPETFDPTLRRRAQAERAEIFFATGVLPYEEKLHPAVKRFVDTSEGIAHIYGTHVHDHHGHDGNASHSHSHEGEAPDPHTWTSVSGGRQMAVNMAGALTEAYPDSATVYAARLSKLLERIDSLDSYVRRRVAGTHAFAIWHPSLSYFAREYGLHQIPLGQESKDLSARQLKQAIDEAAADSVHVFFIQQEYDTRQARTINDKIGSRLVTIAPLDYDWEQQLKLIADELAR